MFSIIPPDRSWIRDSIFLPTYRAVHTHTFECGTGDCKRWCVHTTSHSRQRIKKPMRNRCLKCSPINQSQTPWCLAWVYKFIWTKSEISCTNSEKGIWSIHESRCHRQYLRFHVYSINMSIKTAIRLWNSNRFILESLDRPVCHRRLMEQPINLSIL